MNPTVFGATERAVLGSLADLLIPATRSMPSASQAGVTREWLDAVLTARPDLSDPLAAILVAARGAEPSEGIERLKREGGFAMFVELVTNAYYMNPDVRSRIRYPLQQAVPIDPSDGEDAEAQSLIESVRARGPNLPTHARRRDAVTPWSLVGGSKEWVWSAPTWWASPDARDLQRRFC